MVLYAIFEQMFLTLQISFEGHYFFPTVFLSENMKPYSALPDLGICYFFQLFKCKVIFFRFSYTLNLSPVFSGVLIWKHFIFLPCTSFFFTSLYLPLTLILIFSHDRMLTLHQNMFPLKGFGKYFETCTGITASNDVFRFPPTYFNMIGFTHKKRSIRFSHLRMQPACHKF